MPSLTPVPSVIQRCGVTTVEYDWSHEPRVLSVEAIRAVLSACAKHDARSARVGQCSICIRLDVESRASEIRERVTEILTNSASWKRVIHRPKLPREMLVVRGNGDGRGWDYTQHLASEGDAYEMGT